MKAWNIQRTQFKVSDFVTWYRSNQLDLSPIFQRRPVWPAGAKSYLVDTVMRGLPIPAIILRDVPTNLETFEAKREVVDGQQRIRTLISFVAPNILRDYQPSDHFALARAHNPEFRGFRYNDLPKEIRQRILDYQFMAHIFPSETDDREILEIFARMNATGFKLNHQELRNASFFGEFKTAAYGLASEQLPRWRDWDLFTEAQIARMAEVELTSELMILIINGISEGSKSTIDRFYKRYEPDQCFPRRKEVERRFRAVMDQISKHFTPVDRKPFEKKSLFYPLFASVYACLYGLRSDLERRRAKLLTASDKQAISRAGARIANKTAPERILEISQRRTSQAGVRKELTKYLLTKTSADGEPGD